MILAKWKGKFDHLSGTSHKRSTKISLLGGGAGKFKKRSSKEMLCEIFLCKSPTFTII